MIRLEPRPEPSRLAGWLSPLAAAGVTLLIGFVVFSLLGKNPLDAFHAFFVKPVDSAYGVAELLLKASPLMLIATGLAVGYRANVWNIGAEGQLLVGAIAGGGLALALHESGSPVLLPAMIVAGALGGMLWAAIPAVLKVKRGVNEVIATIMLNSIALSVIDWLFQEFFRWESEGGSLDVKTKPLPESAWMPDLIEGKLNAFIVIALAVVFTFWVVVFKSRFGFRLRASGLNAGAARTAGISANRMIVTAMLMSGAVAGIVGLQSLLGNVHAYGTTRPDGFGFKGIAVALLGRNHPAGIVIAALLFGFLDAVAGPLQVEKIPQSIVLVIQAVILLTVVIVNEVVSRWLDRRTAERAARALVSAEVAA